MSRTTGPKIDSSKARLIVGDKELEMPVLVGTENDRAIDISKLLKETGHITIDEGYANTGSAASAITFLDGETGVLRHRGYPIEQLAEHCSFLETSYLLIYGELPTREQLEQFADSIEKHTMLHEDMRSFYNGFPRDAAPHGDSFQRCWCPVHVLSGLARSARSRASRSFDPSFDRQVAYDCGIQLQEVVWSAIHLSRQQSGLLRELSQHDVCVAE